MNISKDVWEEILNVLKKHKIPYTAHYPYMISQDKYIQINLVIQDMIKETLK